MYDRSDTDVGSLFGLDLDLLLPAVGTVVGGLAALFTVRTLRGSGQLKSVAMALVALVVSGVLIGAGAAHRITDGGPGPVDDPDLAFRVPANPSVNQCSVYQGDGRIPDGLRLAIFDRPVNADGTPRAGYFMHREPAENNATGPGWHTPLVEAGDNYVEITAVALTKDLYASLLSISPVDQGPTGAWLIKDLPNGRLTNSFIVQPRRKTAADPSGC